MVGIRWAVAKLSAAMSWVEAMAGGKIQGGIGSVGSSPGNKNLCKIDGKHVTQ